MFKFNGNTNGNTMVIKGKETANGDMRLHLYYEVICYLISGRFVGLGMMPRDEIRRKIIPLSMMVALKIHYINPSIYQKKRCSKRKSSNDISW